MVAVVERGVLRRMFADGHRQQTRSRCAEVLSGVVACFNHARTELMAIARRMIPGEERVQRKQELFQKVQVVDAQTAE